MSDVSSDGRLPRPFYEDGWTRAQRPHARALWDFHVALTDPYAPALDGSDLAAYFSAEHEGVLERRTLNVVSEDVARAAYAACEEAGLPLVHLAEQVQASEAFRVPARYPDNAAINAFVQSWAGSHVRLLAHLAGATGSWQLKFADEFGRAFFWVGRLMTLKKDLDQDRLFIPEADLEQHGVSTEQLREGRPDENVKRLLWKQTIRAKNAFAMAEPLARELPRRQSDAMKRWWLGGLEVLNEIRRRGFDVWTDPVTLSVRHRIQVRFQARFGRTTFRSQ